VRAVLITGPPGSGKTSVLGALSDALSDDDVPHVAVEVEMLVWTHPALPDAERLRHVRAVCAGHPLALVAETLETDADVARLRDAVAADETFVVLLEAAPDTLAARIVAREPASWSGVDALAEHARDLAATMPALVAVDLALSTEGERPEAVAARIRETARL
jgi:AAA domain-containing protein